MTFYSLSVSGMSGDELILGRPYGGCTMRWHCQQTATGDEIKTATW